MMQQSSQSTTFLTFNSFEEFIFNIFFPLRTFRDGGETNILQRSMLYTVAIFGHLIQILQVIPLAGRYVIESTNPFIWFVQYLSYPFTTLARNTSLVGVVGCIIVGVVFLGFLGLLWLGASNKKKGSNGSIVRELCMIFLHLFAIIYVQDIIRCLAETIKCSGSEIICGTDTQLIGVITLSISCLLLLPITFFSALFLNKYEPTSALPGLYANEGSELSFYLLKIFLLVNFYVGENSSGIRIAISVLLTIYCLALLFLQVYQLPFVMPVDNLLRTITFCALITTTIGAAVDAGAETSHETFINVILICIGVAVGCLLTSYRKGNLQGLMQVEINAMGLVTNGDNFSHLQDLLQDEIADESSTYNIDPRLKEKFAKFKRSSTYVALRKNLIFANDIEIATRHIALHWDNLSGAQQKIASSAIFSVYLALIQEKFNSAEVFFYLAIYFKNLFNNFYLSAILLKSSFERLTSIRLRYGAFCLQRSIDTLRVTGSLGTKVGKFALNDFAMLRKMIQLARSHHEKALRLFNKVLKQMINDNKTKALHDVDEGRARRSIVLDADGSITVRTKKGEQSYASIKDLQQKYSLKKKGSGLREVDEDEEEEKEKNQEDEGTSGSESFSSDDSGSESSSSEDATETSSEYSSQPQSVKENSILRLRRNRSQSIPEVPKTLLSSSGGWKKDDNGNTKSGANALSNINQDRLVTIQLAIDNLNSASSYYQILHSRFSNNAEVRLLHNTFQEHFFKDDNEKDSYSPFPAAFSNAIGQVPAESLRNSTKASVDESMMEESLGNFSSEVIAEKKARTIQLLSKTTSSFRLVKSAVLISQAVLTILIIVVSVVIITQFNFVIDRIKDLDSVDVLLTIWPKSCDTLSKIGVITNELSYRLVPNMVYSQRQAEIYPAREAVQSIYNGTSPLADNLDYFFTDLCVPHGNYLRSLSMYTAKVLGCYIIISDPSNPSAYIGNYFVSDNTYTSLLPTPLPLTYSSGDIFAANPSRSARWFAQTVKNFSTKQTRSYVTDTAPDVFKRNRTISLYPFYDINDNTTVRGYYGLEVTSGSLRDKFTVLKNDMVKVDQDVLNAVSTILQFAAKQDNVKISEIFHGTGMSVRSVSTQGVESFENIGLQTVSSLFSKSISNVIDIANEYDIDLMLKHPSYVFVSDLCKSGLIRELYNIVVAAMNHLGNVINNSVVLISCVVALSVVASIGSVCVCVYIIRTSLHRFDDSNGASLAVRIFAELSPESHVALYKRFKTMKLPKYDEDEGSIIQANIDPGIPPNNDNTAADLALMDAPIGKSISQRRNKKDKEATDGLLEDDFKAPANRQEGIPSPSRMQDSSKTPLKNEEDLEDPSYAGGRDWTERTTQARGKDSFSPDYPLRSSLKQDDSKGGEKRKVSDTPSSILSKKERRTKESSSSAVRAMRRVKSVFINCITGKISKWIILFSILLCSAILSTTIVSLNRLFSLSSVQKDVQDVTSIQVSLVGASMRVYDITSSSLVSPYSQYNYVEIKDQYVDNVQNAYNKYLTFVSARDGGTPLMRRYPLRESLTYDNRCIDVFDGCAEPFIAYSVIQAGLLKAFFYWYERSLWYGENKIVNGLPTPPGLLEVSLTAESPVDMWMLVKFYYKISNGLIAIKNTFVEEISMIGDSYSKEQILFCVICVIISILAGFILSILLKRKMKNIDSIQIVLRVIPSAILLEQGVYKTYFDAEDDFASDIANVDDDNQMLDVK